MVKTSIKILSIVVVFEFFLFYFVLFIKYINELKNTIFKRNVINYLFLESWHFIT